MHTTTVTWDLFPDPTAQAVPPLHNYFWGFGVKWHPRFIHIENPPRHTDKGVVPQGLLQQVKMAGQHLLV